MTKLVRRAAGTPLSEDAIQELQNLAAMPDEEIDYSDIPMTPPGFWTTRASGDSSTGQLTIQVPLDTDVVEFFRKQGEPLTVAVNTALRKLIQSETAAGQSKEKHKKAS